MPLHPREVLQSTGADDHWLVPCCEHYAGSPRKLQKALDLQAARGFDFDVTLDLEDGAPAGAESEAVRELVSLVNQHDSFQPGQNHRLGCRVHPYDHPSFADDLHCLAFDLQTPLAYLTLPKADSLEQAKAALQMAGQVFSAAKKPLPDIQILAETHGSVRDVFGIAALPEVRFISFGQMDFTSAHGGAIPASCMKSPGQFEHPLLRRAKLEISAACHAYGKIPTHNPTVDYNNTVQTQSDAEQARWLGFGRMWSIHPDQVSPILKAFAPGAHEVAKATAILLAAQAADWGPIAFEGELHDRASYRYFWGLLRKAHAMHLDLPDEAKTAFFST
jgi:citrate lyase subunit beta / citryl-CoA lyase